MKRLLKLAAEAASFGSLAVLLLLTGFISRDEMGLQSGGSGGASEVTVAVASIELAEMVRNWERSAQAQTTIASPVKPANPQAELLAINVPGLDLSPSQAVQIRLPSVPQLNVAVVDNPIAAPEPYKIPNRAPHSGTDEVQREQEKREVPRPKQKKVAQPAKTIEASATPQHESPKKQAATQKSSGETAQRAGGIGGKALSGRSTNDVTMNGAEQARNAQLESIWSGRIKSRIGRAQRYPRSAEGTAVVVVKVFIDVDGRLISYRIIRSSGQSVFDQAAVDAIKSVRRYPKAPRGYTGGQASFNAPLVFQR